MGGDQRSWSAGTPTYAKYIVSYFKETVGTITSNKSITSHVNMAIKYIFRVNSDFIINNIKE